MTLYRSKHAVEAMQWDGGNREAFYAFVERATGNGAAEAAQLLREGSVK